MVNNTEPASGDGKPSADSTTGIGGAPVAENANDTAMTRSFLFLALLPLALSNVPPRRQVTNCGRYFDGGSLLWTSLRITTLPARLGAAAPPSGSPPNEGFTRNGRRQFKGSNEITSSELCTAAMAKQGPPLLVRTALGAISDSRRRRILSCTPSSRNTTMGREGDVSRCQRGQRWETPNGTKYPDKH